jgi:hypothetical protein
MKSLVAWITVLILISFAVGEIALGAVPQLVSYQGRLTNAVGQPIDSLAEITFYLYGDSLGVDQLWTETHSKVQITDGLFTVLLGSINTTFSSYFEGKSCWLGMRLGSGSVSSPLTRIASVAYAFKAQKSDTAAVALNASSGPWVVNGSNIYYTTGNVGVGTAAPAYRLDVTGDAQVLGGVRVGNKDLDGSLRIYRDGATNPFVYAFAGTYGGNLVIQEPGGSDIIKLMEDATGTGGYLSVNRNTTTAGFIVDGNYGSGGSSTYEPRVDIIGSLRSARFHMDQSGDTSVQLPSQAISSAEILNGTILNTDIDADANISASKIYGTAATLSADQTFEGDNIFSAKVGIGTTDPGNHKLSVDGTSSGYSGSALYARTEHASGVAANCYANSTYPTVVAYQKGTGDIFRGYAVDDADVSTTVARIKADGRVVCPVLELTGGSDVAEPFEMTESGELPAGALVVIDENNPGSLRLADSPYDARVAGVVSGAGGVNPGITLSQKGVNGAGQNVAISGRVYCLADASYGPIKPGDLLTTSATKGHAMVASNRDKAYGTVIGKAMSALESGTGLVLILVSLQ